MKTAEKLDFGWPLRLVATAALGFLGVVNLLLSLGASDSSADFLNTANVGAALLVACGVAWRRRPRRQIRGVVAPLGVCALAALLVFLSLSLTYDNNGQGTLPRHLDWWLSLVAAASLAVAAGWLVGWLARRDGVSRRTRSSTST